ncbi:MAG: bifunctional 5,10-methylenetetrahydrofolate dehydrogenase/5,10-methenyltetrahydrofolate cyclohydrolase [bacterium]|nr:bifunctional 5,10-methylenetetrahydrofolate dehydrogenase/5,10-methenyltetrahydrofolate cyclohydrolase [bacterium]
MIIKGKEIAQKIIEGLKKENRPDKILAAVLVGSTSSPQVAQSKSFLRQKELMAKELGIVFELFQFGEDILENDLIAEIKKISADPEIGGIIIQLPLPKHYEQDKILAAVDPKKDVDALTPESRKLVNPLPVEVVWDVLGIMNYELGDKAIAVIGRGFLVGKPIAEYFKDKCKKLEVFHSKSDLSNLKEFDLVISGVGKAGLIKPKMLKTGAIAIDFGYDFQDGKIKGDFDLNGAEERNIQFTPTPGGTGPILVAEIFKNFYKLCNGL